MALLIQERPLLDLNNHPHQLAMCYEDAPAEISCWGASSPSQRKRILQNGEFTHTNMPNLPPLRFNVTQSRIAQV